MLTRSKVIGIIVGLGFAIPSFIGFLKPIASAKKWQLVLDTQPAIDQYRTLAIFVFALGVFICIGTLKESTQKYTLTLALFLILSLLIGRLISYSIGSITNLLIIESIAELIGLTLLIWALKSENV